MCPKFCRYPVYYEMNVFYLMYNNYSFFTGPELKVIATYSLGYEHIDVEECKKR